MKVQVTTQALLFDMDGVLISSITSARRCWRVWARRYDVPGADTLEIRHGIPARDLIRGFRPDLTPEQVAEGVQVIEDLEIADVDGLEVLPGVRDLLAALPTERWTIVTSATRRLLLGRLTAAKLAMPDRLITADDVTRGKPDPEPYRKGAELLGFASADCIVVEDAPGGIRAGLAAGSPVLGVLGTHTAAELYEAGATWVADGLRSVRVASSAAGLQLSFEPL